MHYTLKTPYTPETPVSSHRSSRIEVLSPDGFWLAVGGLSDHTVVLFKAVEGAWRPWMTYYQHREGVYNRQGTIQALAWSPDGQQIASASSTGSIHVWAVRGAYQRTIRRKDEKPAQALHWNEDGLQIVDEDGANKQIAHVNL